MQCSRIEHLLGVFKLEIENLVCVFFRIDYKKDREILRQWMCYRELGDMICEK